MTTLKEEIEKKLWEVLSTAVTIEVRKSPRAEVERYISQVRQEILSLVKSHLKRLNDEEIEVWLLNRLGEGNRFEQFNKHFCRDISQATIDKIKEELEK